jgi:glycosyltransferase involved in cell wall biosynthesis
MSHLELTILMPCLNEAKTLEYCIKEAKKYLIDNAIAGEVLISDNGSTDGSQEIAEKHGARVIHAPEKGYGSALRAGIEQAHGQFIIMGDSDQSYDFSNLNEFVAKLRNGYELVMGNRFKGGIQPGAMPPLHKYLGNPVLSGLGQLLFQSPIKDFHCGLRGFRRDAILGLKLNTPGMEFASEMIVKATLHKLKIAEIPTILRPDGRGRPPHLNSFRDGWRHLKFLLLHSPKWLFFYPGIFIFLVSLFLQGLLIYQPLQFAGFALSIQTLLYVSVASIIGLQMCLLALISTEYSYCTNIAPDRGKAARLLQIINLENGLIVGAVFMVFGVGLGLWSVSEWIRLGMGSFSPEQSMRIAIPSAFFLLMGAEIMLASLLLALIRIFKHHTNWGSS